MSEKKLFKIGYYTIYEITNTFQKTYRVDNGKKLLVKRFNKVINNPYRDRKDFKTIDEAKKYVVLKMEKNLKEKKTRMIKSPMTLYLILIKEEKSEKVFVKVGITSKKVITERYHKKYGYDGYTVETILRNVSSPIAEELETKIKNKLNKKRSIKKYRPILESFSGYSECYDYLCLDEIVKIFDELVHLGAK